MIDESTVLNQLLGRLEDSHQRIGRLEAKIDSTPIPDRQQMNLDTFERFVGFVRADNFIEAIRLVRGTYGLGLKEAKDITILLFPSRQ